MSGLRVIRPGPLSLLQDAGRFGWQHLGVSPSGPLDGHAAAWANRLLGNRWGTPLLEIALGDVQLQAEVDTWLAVCGADLPLSIDGAPRPNWSRFPLRAGQQLRLGFARSGQRSYLAVVGGFQASTVLGSVATQRREGLGGLSGEGQALQAGDYLRCAPARLQGSACVPWYYVPDYRLEPTLRVIMAAEPAGFTAAQARAFLDRSWSLSARSDRMGARLQGEPLSAPLQQWSVGVSLGAIQVPPDGQPIILMADRQTIGGYPVLGWLHPLDLWRLAQCPANSSVRFEATSLTEAQQALRRFQRFFRERIRQT